MRISIKQPLEAMEMSRSHGVPRGRIEGSYPKAALVCITPLGYADDSMLISLTGLLVLSAPMQPLGEPEPIPAASMQAVGKPEPIPAASMQPVGEPRALEGGELGSAFVATPEAGVTFDVTGPTTIRWVLYARSTARRTPIQIELLRDDVFSSTQLHAFVLAEGGAPKGYPTCLEIHQAIGDGEHALRVHSPDGPLLVAAVKMAQAPEGALMATPEVNREPQIETPPADSAAAGTPCAETPPDAVATQSPVPDEPAAPTVQPPPPDPAAPDAALRIAVYDLESLRIPKSLTVMVNDNLLAELRKLRGVTAVGMDEIRDMLSHEANKQILGCEADDACLAEIAGALGVDELITGRLTDAADGRQFLLRRIDQGRAAVVQSTTQRFEAGSGEEFLLAIGPMVESLYSNRPLVEGAARGVPEETVLLLNPPPLPLWGFVTTASAAVVALGLGTGFGVSAFDNASTFNSLADNPTVQGSDLLPYEQSASRDQSIANGMLVGAAVLATAAGVMAFFTDWYGAADNAP